MIVENFLLPASLINRFCRNTSMPSIRLQASAIAVVRANDDVSIDRSP